MKLRATSLLAAVLFASLPALAAGRDEESTPSDLGDIPDVDLVRAPDRSPKPGTPLIANLLYPMQNRLEFTGFFDFSYADKYVEHLGGHGALTYHVFDWLAVEGFGGYWAGDETNIAKTVRQRGRTAQNAIASPPIACATPTCEPELPDLWQTTWMAGADIQWAPIYGKLSVVSEYDLNFQLYGLLGGGVEGVRMKLNGDANGDGVANDYRTDPSVRVNMNYGLGLRLIPWKWVALRLELRNYTGLNPEVPEVNGQGTDVCTDGYSLTVGPRTECSPDFTNNAMVQLGVSFVL